MSGRLSRLFGQVLFLSLLAFVVSGCPALLKDDFKKGPGDASVGGNAGTGGTSGSGGTAGTDASAGMGGGGGTDGGQDADAEANPCANCGAGETCCDNSCVKLNSDPANCGTCGHGCKGTTCASGNCTNDCAFGFLNCNQNIIDGCEVNAATDVDNCGSCGVQCGFDATCTDGKCVCPTGSADCNGDPADGCETDISSDPLNCGQCGKTCGANETCTDSQCGCATGFADCNGQADDGCEVDTTSDPLHCGVCSNDCGANTTCSGSTCGCMTGYLDCDSTAGCETAKTDPNNCGTCGHVCSGTTALCDGTTCQATCGGGTKLCGSSCVDTQTDPNNCGDCGIVVGANQDCQGGVPTCLTGFADCNGQASDGCEIDTRSDNTHCGTCSNACKPGAICTSSQCQCAATTPNDCGNSCQECCDASQCSDGNGCTTNSCVNGSCSFSASCASGGLCCGQLACYECCSDTDCTNGKVCSGNVCVTPSCTGGTVLCNGTCVDIQTDSSNCGGCGNDCGVGRNCSSGSCTPQWVTMPASPLGARDQAAFAWTGTQVFVWGGENASKTAVANGALYDPATNTWATAGTSGTRPSARIQATAVWTGSVVVVWGGGDVGGGVVYNDGSRYDPSTGSWQAMTTTGAPSGRLDPYGVWTGSRVLFWGGYNAAGTPLGGAWLYDPVNDTWTQASTSGGPGALGEAAIGFSGTNLYLYGGKPVNANLTSYNPGSDAWASLTGGWSQRFGAFGRWDGTYFIVWGGETSGQPNAFADGKRYDPVNDNWSSMLATGAPAGRYVLHRQTGWTARTSSSTTLFLGGVGPKKTDNHFDGGLYNSTSNSWTAVPAWPSGEQHYYAVGVWAGTEFVLWGGQNNGTATNTGERFRP